MNQTPKIINKKEYAFWKRKVKLLSPKKGDILIVPAEAMFDFHTLGEALKLTPIKYALVVPEGKAELMSQEDALKFAKKVLAEAGD
jgi:hypothetical protein